MILKTKVALVFFSLILLSCGNQPIFDEYVAVGSAWNEQKEVQFALDAPDTTLQYNVFLQLRNNRKYPFSNIFLIVQTEAPDKTVMVDTLEYAMTKPDGTFLGSGFSDLKENKLFFREKIRFEQLGTYQIRIRHAVRNIGAIEGVGDLEGITDVGLKIENADIN
jgi:gliding motility-associated lipoprotein GldH